MDKQAYGDAGRQAGADADGQATMSDPLVDGLKALVETHGYSATMIRLKELRPRNTRGKTTDERLVELDGLLKRGLTRREISVEMSLSNARDCSLIGTLNHYKSRGEWHHD